MAGSPRQEMIALGSAEVTRERLGSYVEALGNAAIFLACDSRITERGSCGAVLRMTRQDLLALKHLLAGVRDEFDESMEGLTR